MFILSTQAPPGLYADDTRQAIATRAKRKYDDGALMKKMFSSQGCAPFSSESAS